MASDLVKKLIVGFGFFNGVWFSIGISPSEEILSSLKPIIEIMPPFIKTIFTLIPIFLTFLSIITLFIIYARGGILGSAAVVLAFFAGAIIFKIWWVSLILLVVAYIMGIGLFRRTRY